MTKLTKPAKSFHPHTIKHYYLTVVCVPDLAFLVRPEHSNEPSISEDIKVIEMFSGDSRILKTLCRKLKLPEDFDYKLLARLRSAPT